MKLVEKIDNHQILIKQPEIGVIIPIHNAASHIYRVLAGALYSQTLPGRWILLLDGCRDDSLGEVRRFLKDNKLGLAHKSISVHIYASALSRFESWCDNFGLSKLREFKIVIEIQADILLQDLGYDQRFVKIFEAFPDLLLLSGRGVHDWEFPYESPSTFTEFKNLFSVLFTKRKFDYTAEEKHELPKITLIEQEFLVQKYFGRCGRLHEAQISNIDEFTNTVFVGQTVMRGPLAVNVEKLKGSLNKFCHTAHRLGNDDHELSLRAWRSEGLRVGYHPVQFASPLLWGSTRNRRSLFSSFEYRLMRLFESLFASRSELYRNSSITAPEREIRKIV